MIAFDDFTKLDIRIGAILSVEKIEKSDKLLKIMVDLGSEKRQIVSGIAKFYPDSQVLVGKQVPVLMNLEYRKMMGVESQGMILMVDDKDSAVQLYPENKVNNGEKVR